MSAKLKSILSLSGAFAAGVMVTVLLMLAFGFRTSHWTAEQSEAARVKAIIDLRKFDPLHPMVAKYEWERFSENYRSVLPDASLKEVKAAYLESLLPHVQTQSLAEELGYRPVSRRAR